MTIGCPARLHNDRSTVMDTIHLAVFMSLHLSCLWSVISAQTSGPVNGADGDPIFKLYSLNLSEKGEVVSENFPESCCVYEKITISIDTRGAPNTPSYIHVSFDDLDLPVGTQFRIYSVESEHPSALFREQPDYKRGVWWRPYIVSSTLVHMVLRPRRPASNATIARYAGFKAKFEVSKEDKPYRPPTSDLCPAVSTVTAGGQVRVSPQPQYRGYLLDCLWLLKPPLDPEGKAGRAASFRVYVRFDELTINSGKVYIKEGKSSVETSVAEASSLLSLNQDQAGFVSQPDSGFYIRAVFPADQRRNRLSFVYGYIKYVRQGRACGSSYHQCDTPYDRWCIPSSHVCNSVENCPRGEDEGWGTCNVGSTTTRRLPVQQPSTTTTTAVRVSCGENKKFCSESAVCVALYEICPGTCYPNEKKCADGSCIPLNTRYCLEESCPERASQRCGNSTQCYSQAERCDLKWDCNNGVDEHNCGGQFDDGTGKVNKSKLLLLLVIPLIVCVAIPLCYKYCRRKSTTRDRHNVPMQVIRRSDGDNDPEDLPHTPVNPHTSLSPGGARPSPAPSRHSYSAVPSSDRPSPRDDSAPPSYDEVATSNSHPAPRATEEPPPSYERAIEGPQIHIL